MGLRYITSNIIGQYYFVDSNHKQYFYFTFDLPTGSDSEDNIGFIFFKYDKLIKNNSVGIKIDYWHEFDI